MKPQETQTQITIDPKAMNIVNRLAAGSLSTGPLHLNGGLLLQGDHRGNLTVRGGPLVIAEGGSIANGTIEVDGDTYVFGRVGAPDDAVAPTFLRCSGVLHLTSKAISYGTLQCAKPAIYEGAQVRGTVETTEAIEPSA